MAFHTVHDRKTVVEALNNPLNRFAVHASLVGGKKKIVLQVLQQNILNTIEGLKDLHPKSVTVYWSQAPVYPLIVADLMEDRSLPFYQKLVRLSQRCPYIYKHTFKKDETYESN